MGKYLEFLTEAISPEDRKKITDYTKGLKSWLKKNYPGPDWKVTTGKSLRPNPYLDVRCGWPEKKVPNELRLKLVDAIYPNGRSTVRNIDDVEYGNISERGLAAQYSQWIKVTGETLNEELLSEAGMIRITVPYTDRRMTQKTLDDMGYDYEIGNGSRGATVIFDITVDEYEDSALIKKELISKRVRLLNEDAGNMTSAQRQAEKKMMEANGHYFINHVSGGRNGCLQYLVTTTKNGVVGYIEITPDGKIKPTEGAEHIKISPNGEILNESTNDDLITAYETGKKAGEAHANKDQGSVSHHSDWFKKFKRLSKSDKQALEAEYTKGYKETSGFHNKPSYFK